MNWNESFAGSWRRRAGGLTSSCRPGLRACRTGSWCFRGEGGRPRKLQRLRMEELEALGCFTAVVDGPESARDAIGELLKQEPAAPAADRLFLEMVNRRPGKGGTAF